MEPPLKKTTFPEEFCDDYYTLCLYTKNNKKKKYKKKKKKYRFKMAAKWLIFVSRHFDFGKNLKNHWLKIGYLNTDALKIGNFYYDGILGAKYYFPHPQNSNLC